MHGGGVGLLHFGNGMTSGTLCGDVDTFESRSKKL